MKILTIILFPFLLIGNWSIGCRYNLLYPQDTLGVCDRVNVNHQAVAMGQVINYWKFPVKGWGQESYISNYGTLSADYQLGYDWNSIDTSRLLLDCDIACHSSYSIYMQAWQCGIINLDTINKALHNHFGYKWGIVITSDLSSLVALEIAQERPVIMELYPTNFQCSRFVVVDGYQNGYFHFNFGVVSGPFIMGGWFPLDSVYTMGTYWTLNQKALIGIEPDVMTISGQLLNDNTLSLIPGQVNNVQIPNGTFSFVTNKQWLELNATTTSLWGNVNSIDALEALKHFVGITDLVGLKKRCADVNGDGVINSVDALYTMKRFVGLINSFPAGDWIYEPIIVNKDTTVSIKMRCVGDIN